MATNPKLFEIADTLSRLTVLEAKELLDILENDYGIKPAEAIVSPINLAVEKPAEPEQTEFDLFLKNAGAQKLQLVKKIKELKNLSLIEAKQLVDSAPCKILEKASKKDIDIFKTELENLGAIIEVQ